jgi:hypothetical protein
MPGFDTGLKHRVKRLAQQIADQHRHLSLLRREIDAALERGERDAAGDAFARFEAALLAHFDLEQGLFFPALHGLSPARSDGLEALEREHASLRAKLRSMAAGIEGEPLGPTRAALEQCLAALRDHETREEALVALISNRS